MDDKSTEETGFGLAATKQEGKCGCYSDPSILPWDGCGKEFDDFFHENYCRWYLKPLKKILKKTLANSWNMALLANARKITENQLADNRKLVNQ